MSFVLIVTLLVLVGLIVALALEKWPAELVMLAALPVLVCCGFIKINNALKGFANEAVLTIGALFVVAAGLERRRTELYANKCMAISLRTISGVIHSTPSASGSATA